MPLTDDQISQESNKTVEDSTNVSTLGNAIRQYSDNGLNSQRERWTIVSTVIDEATLLTVEATLTSVGGGKDLLTWTPRDGSTVSKNWVVVGGTRSIEVLSGHQYRIQFTIEEEH